MIHRRRVLLAAFSCAAISLVARARADETTKLQCVEASESGQTLRQGGMLRAARAKFLICLANTCPGPIRDDCGEQLTEIDLAVPMIVFAVVDPAGNTIANARVSMDGNAVADGLAGAPLMVDPGEHVFVFTAEGYETLSRKVVFREGVKARREVVALKAARVMTTRESAAGASATTASPAAMQPKSDGPRSALSANDQRTVAYVLGGAGIVSLGVGTYFGLHAKSTYDDATSSANCPTGLSSCDQAGIDGGKSAHTQATASTIAFVLGGGLFASGVVLFITAPKDGAVNVRPTAGTSSAGMQLGGRW